MIKDWCALNETECTYCQARECVWRVTAKEAFEEGSLVIDDSTDDDGE